MKRDFSEILAALRQSNFRRCKRLGVKDAEYLHNKGIRTILQHAREFVEKRLAPAEPANDGKQTPWRGHPVFVAQHATATCCRGCVQKWHKIPQGRELSDAEIEFMVQLIGAWLENEVRNKGVQRTSNP